MNRRKKKLGQKSIEVVWRREDGPKITHRSHLPRIREIDLEGSAVKKPAKSVTPSRATKKYVTRVHKRVRRSLFPEDKKNELKECFDVPESKKQSSELCPPNVPSFVLNREKTRAEQGASARESNTLQTETVSKTVDSSPSQRDVRDASTNRPSIVVELHQINPRARGLFRTEFSDFMSNQKLIDNMPNDLSKVSDHENKSAVSHREFGDNVTSPSKRRGGNLSETSKLVSRPKSPPIVSNREKYITHLNACPKKSNQRPFVPSKRIESSNLVRKISCNVESTNKDEKRIIPRVLNVRRPFKSPEIVSNRKRSYGHDGSLDKTNGFKDDRIKAQATRIPDENIDEPRDPVKSPEKKSDGLPVDILKSPPIVASSQKRTKSDLETALNLFKQNLYRTTKNLKTVESSLLQSSVHDTPVMKSSAHTARNRMISRESNSAGYAKSPEIVSNRERSYGHDCSLDKTNGFKHDWINAQATRIQDENLDKPRDLVKSPGKKSDGGLPVDILKSPPIVASSQKRTKSDLETALNLFKQNLYQTTKNLKTVESSPLQSSVHDTPVMKSSAHTARNRMISHESNSAGYTKSPEIVSNRKRCNNENSNLNRKQEFDRDESNMATITRDENHLEPCDPVSCFRKSSDSLSEAAPEMSSLPESTPITLCKKKMRFSSDSSFCKPVLLASRNVQHSNTVGSPPSSAHDMPVIKMSSDTTRSQTVSRKSYSGHAKSPVIMSNCKRSYENGNLNATDELDRGKLNVAVNTAQNENHLEPSNVVPCSRKKMTDSLSETSKISSRPKSPPIVTDKKIIKIGLEALFCESKQHPPIRTEKIFDTSIIKPSNITRNERNPRAGDSRLSKSPEIMSNRKRHSTEMDDGKLEDKLNVTAATVDKSIENDHNRNVIGSKNKCKASCLFEAPQTSFGPGSLQIITNRKKTKMEDNTNLIPVSKRRLFRNSDDVGANKPLLSSRSDCGSANTAQNRIKRCTDYEPCRRKSPEITSNRKLHVGVRHNDMSKINVSEFDRSNTGTYGICKNDRRIDNRVVSPKKRPDGLFKVPQEYAYSEIPQVIPNCERINTAGDTWIPISKRRLLQTVKIVDTAKALPSDTVQVSSVKPSNSVQNEIELSTDRDVFKSKFLKSDNEKWIMNESKVVAQASVNRKSESVVNTRSIDLPLTSNSEHSEDIVESSEPTCLNDRILEKNKTRRWKKSKTKRHVHKKQADELLRVLDGPPAIVFQGNEFKNKAELVKTNRNEMCNELMSSDCSDIIHTANVVKSPFNELKIKNLNEKIKNSFTELQDNQDLSPTKLKLNDVQKCSILPILLGAEENEDDLTPLKRLTNEEYLNKAKSNKVVTFVVPSPEISVIPATPEKDAANVDKAVIEKFSDTFSNLLIPLIEVDQSPTTPQGKNKHPALIQSVYSPNNKDCESLSGGVFESVTSPAPCPSNTDVQLPFEIDSAVSPASAVHEVNLLSPEPCRKKMSNNSPSPSHFDSAKKRKKVCKDGLRGRFRELINRKKSEACIREYEKTLSKDYQQQPDEESVLLNVIEVWKENTTFVLLCYQTKLQNVLVPLENCPKNVIKNSIIRIYSPWSTIESKTLGLLMYVGVVHVEIIECPGPTRPLGPFQPFTNFNGLLTGVYQSKVLWKCKCSKDTTCQCLGDLSVHNYLQYMVSH